MDLRTIHVSLSDGAVVLRGPEPATWALPPPCVCAAGRQGRRLQPARTLRPCSSSRLASRCVAWAAVWDGTPAGWGHKRLRQPDLQGPAVQAVHLSLAHARMHAGALHAGKVARKEAAVLFANCQLRHT